ncbi:MAG: metallophosphoesterase [Elusimicrobiota bacterium]
MAERVIKALGRRFPNRRRLGHYRYDHYAAVALFILLQAAVFVPALGVIAAVDPFPAWPPALRAAMLAAAALGGACVLYGRFVEPFRLTVRTVELVSPKVGPEPVRLLHLSDMHVGSWGRLEDKLVAAARELKPDAIVLTGDYTAHRWVLADARRLLRELAEVAPTCASLGNAESREPLFTELWRDTGVIGLVNKSADLEARGTRLRLTGVVPGEEDAVMRLGGNFDGYSICLYHYPDLVPEVGRLPYDLMLCGHTHGGQIQLPLIGALITACRADRRYARGLFQKNGKAAFVTQGVGCESHGIPRVRFGCPPEAALLVLRRP